MSTLLSLEGVWKSVSKEDQERVILKNINAKIQEGEFIAILGKSGCGKSTLLRLLSGLSPCSKGNIHFQGRLVEGPVPGISLVFQNFSLLPWLTVLENVELGLEAQGIPPKSRRQKSLEAIDIIGLDGFESAYPKELSGGMQQRVGFARALVVEPALLMMDEAFSALDVLTAENLRNDLLELWVNKKTKIRSVICVTHNIEEALLMADRIFIMSGDPTHVVSSLQYELQVPLSYPRVPESPPFKTLINQVYSLLTNRGAVHAVASPATRPAPTLERVPQSASGIESMVSADLAYILPGVSASQLVGLIETIDAHQQQGGIGLPEVADELHLDLSELFPLTEALEMLHLTKISQGNLCFTEAGYLFAAADILGRKKIFEDHLLQHIPLARYIRSVLDQESTHRKHEDFFLERLNEFLSEDEAISVLKVLIDWARYAELFAYDVNAGVLSLENPT